MTALESLRARMAHWTPPATGHLDPNDPEARGYDPDAAHDRRTEDAL